MEAAHGLFMAEGEKVITRAVAAGYGVRSMLVTPDKVASLAGVAGACAGPVYVISHEAAERVTGYRVHRGALASMNRRAAHLGHRRRACSSGGPPAAHGAANASSLAAAPGIWAVGLRRAARLAPPDRCAGRSCRSWERRRRFPVRGGAGRGCRDLVTTVRGSLVPAGDQGLHGSGFRHPVRPHARLACGGLAEDSRRGLHAAGADAGSVGGTTGRCARSGRGGPRCSWGPKGTGSRPAGWARPTRRSAFR